MSKAPQLASAPPFLLRPFGGPPGASSSPQSAATTHATGTARPPKAISALSSCTGFAEWRAPWFAGTSSTHQPKFWETTTAALFAGFLGLLLESVGKPLTVILDNASIHQAKAIQPLLALLKKKGLTLHFLPPYRPELNRIEKLWHQMKYEWVAFKDRSAATLEADVDAILDGFGSKYRMTFC